MHFDFKRRGLVATSVIGIAGRFEPRTRVVCLLVYKHIVKCACFYFCIARSGGTDSPYSSYSSNSLLLVAKVREGFDVGVSLKLK